MRRVLALGATALALLTAALFLTAPAAAWSAHDLTHASTPVGVNVVHHHDESGAVVIHHEPSEPADEDTDRKGHAHILSLSIVVAALLHQPSLRHPALSPAVPAEMKAPQRLPSLAYPPPQRPPSNV